MAKETAKTAVTKETTAKPKVNIADLSPVEEDAQSATLFVVEFTMITIPGGTAANGDIVTADDLGNMKDLHLERGAIRPATFEEQTAYEAATK
jgi:hypothetical protein